MRKIGTLFACLALLTFGCDDSRGGDDAGGIMFLDSGPRADGGPGGSDSGGGTVFPTACDVSGFVPLPAACTPRCTAATGTAAEGCADAMCIQTTLEADPTPALTLTGPGGTAMIGCFDCFLWQLQTCWQTSCPTEFDAWNTCLGGGGTCMPEIDTLQACLTANDTAIQTCSGPLIDQCFAPATGFLPNFEPRQFNLDLGAYAELAISFDPSLF